MDQNDIIADISKDREKYFGCSGKMLMPSPATVAAFVSTIPRNRLITMDRLQRELAHQFNVQVTCPVAARKALEAIAREASGAIPYWRVVKRTGELMPRFPGGLDGHAALLRKEGFSIDTSGKAPRVARLADSLVSVE